jgi:hypothetical protein
VDQAFCDRAVVRFTSQDPENTVEDTTVVHPRNAPRLAGRHWLDDGAFIVGEFITMLRRVGMFIKVERAQLRSRTSITCLRSLSVLPRIKLLTVPSIDARLHLRNVVLAQPGQIPACRTKVEAKRIYNYLWLCNLQSSQLVPGIRAE